MGESLATIEKHSTPLEEATTLSLEALQAYTTGFKTRHLVRLLRAQPLFERAVAIDPDFALAHAYLGFSYTAVGRVDAGAAEHAQGVSVARSGQRYRALLD